MPKSNGNRARGKHKGGRVQWTGNKFLLTSAEAQIIQGQLGMLQQHLIVSYGGLNARITALEPQPVEVPAADTATGSTPVEVAGTAEPASEVASE